MAKRLILVAGKPGSGKSTASELAAQQLGDVYHFSLGEELRARALQGKPSRYAAELQAYATDLKYHRPVPAPLSALVVEECIATSPFETILVDGYPQYADRLPGLQASLDHVGAVILAVCELQLPDEIAASRLTGREQRAADVAEDSAYIARRLEGYYQNVVPTVAALAAQYPLYAIDATQSPERVAAELAAVVADRRFDPPVAV
jgi:adenylate kinase family enzyme